MKYLTKASYIASIVLLSGVTYGSFNIGHILNSKVINKTGSGLEKLGIIYRSNKSCKTLMLDSETQLAQLVKEALTKNPKTATLNLNITTVGSRITISGKAENKKQIQSAIQTTLKVPGVKEVISTVVIDPKMQIASKDSLL